MTPLKTYAHINSLGGQTDEITVLQQVGDNDYLVDYKGVKCHAIFNPFVCEYYADDLYTIVKEDRQRTTYKNSKPTITKTANFSPIR